MTTRDNKTPPRASCGQIAVLYAVLTMLNVNGIQAFVAPMHGAQTDSIAIIIPGVVLRDGKLEEEK